MTDDNPYSRRGLCRKTTFTNENGEVIEIDFKDLVRLREIGSGRYGVVLKFMHRPTQLLLAVKRINCLSNEEDRKQKIMDLDVPRRAGNSEFLVKFYDGLFAEGFIWVLNEIMDTSLDKFYLKAKDALPKLDEKFISRIAYSVLEGISFLKSKLIMHRDIKPSNILLNRGGQIKLCDFGISGFISNSCCLTFTGCYAYMAPEKVRLESMGGTATEGYTIKADIWSLGISMIEIATYNHPFGNLNTFCERMQAILSDTPPRLPANEFSNELCSFVDRCLVLAPDQRGDLHDLLEHEFITKNRAFEMPSDRLLAFIRDIIDRIEADLSPE